MVLGYSKEGEGVYLGVNGHLHRILVRTQEKEWREETGTPRIYAFDEYNFDRGTLIVKFPHLGERLEGDKKEYAERLLNRKGIQDA